MAEVHVPSLGAPEADAGIMTATANRPLRSKSLLKIALDVVLISTGVFLGLMGERWRERAQHRELAEGSLRRFRAEIITNRNALAAEMDYHATMRRNLEAYLGAAGPKTLQTFHVQFHGLGPVFFEQTAWDLALATQALAYIDSDLAFALSRVYTIQRGYAAQQAAVVQSTIYGRSWNLDFAGYWRSVLFYYGDLAVLDPTLLRGPRRLGPDLAPGVRRHPPADRSRTG